jgi:hypothetical protein
MAAPESLRWLLTAALLLASAYHLTRVPRFAGADRVAEALHLVMGLSMVAMLWPWGSVVPAPLWVAVFTASTGWFAARALRSAGRRLVMGLFAMSMAAMAWMGATMPAMASSSAGGLATGGLATGGLAMDGMAMDGMDTGHGPLTTVGVISGLLGGYLIVAAGWWFVRGLRLGGLATTPARGPRPLRWSAICHGLMSAAMGLALLAMA